MRIVTSLDGRKLLEFGRVRLFRRPWPHWRPFAFRRWGVTGFGAGPLGVNVYKRHGKLTEHEFPAPPADTGSDDA